MSAYPHLKVDVDEQLQYYKTIRYGTDGMIGGDTATNRTPRTCSLPGASPWLGMIRWGHVSSTHACHRREGALREGPGLQ
jgi:hypothetical protein